MGLDMYLNAERYIFFNESLKEKVSNLNIVPTDFEPKGINYRLAYWRKANAIHKWFVDNVQDGNDDCEEYDVTLDDLQKLYDVCCQVRDNREKASELLPTISGPFFGTTEYNNFYFTDIEDTIKMLGKILSCDFLKDSSWYITYRASW